MLEAELEAERRNYELEVEELQKANAQSDKTNSQVGLVGLDEPVQNHLMSSIIARSIPINSMPIVSLFHRTVLLT